MKRFIAIIFLLFAAISCGAQPLITARQLNDASNSLRSLNIATSNSLYNLNYATSNYLWSISGSGGGTNVTLAQLLFTSNVLQVFTATVGANDTNFAGQLFDSLSNSVQALTLANSNYTLITAFALSNLVNSRSQALTNLVNVRSISLSNLSYAIGLAGTNYTLATSNAMYLSLNSIILNASNVLARLDTNYIEKVSGTGQDTTLKARNSAVTISANDDAPIAIFGAAFGVNTYAARFPQAGSSKIAAFTSTSALTGIDLVGLTFDGFTLSADAVTQTNRFETMFVTNGAFRLQTNYSSSVTNQIDYMNGPSAHYWSKLGTNLVIQFTNVWSAGVSNRVIDFYFGGGDAGVDYTVTFRCPNPSGVAFRWGVNSTTNGAATVTVTNGMALGASVTGWQSNLFEGYFSHIK